MPARKMVRTASREMERPTRVLECGRFRSCLDVECKCKRVRWLFFEIAVTIRRNQMRHFTTPWFIYFIRNRNDHGQPPSLQCHSWIVQCMCVGITLLFTLIFSCSLDTVARQGVCTLSTCFLRVFHPACASEGACVCSSVWIALTKPCWNEAVCTLPPVFILPTLYFAPKRKVCETRKKNIGGYLGQMFHKIGKLGKYTE